MKRVPLDQQTRAVCILDQAQLAAATGLALTYKSTK